ncbi:bifunctional hydroxymethylpyrimidine kinase/phosphomethylpyrimidine kinase [Paenibacillus taiwanensis]|uniref:bifunctional hydroxymethylpyrimidine kinase/phosphomethylpyrimidine kinase n=1 Tax=Paenibacillus taiwanensis TaxID=401638 RepID=UPI0005644DA8|nr:bifunctional hydroxymethylpyrimidine kinase/phosphomethylpyrimidine kinase [Paenibacillus taiwanensis]
MDISQLSLARVPRALTIAGSDSSGGAGIQADIKTFQECGAYGMSVITAITSQNTNGVRDVHVIPVEHIVSQIDAVQEDIVPDAIKTGMLVDEVTIRTISDKMKAFGWSNVVVDPVMIAKGGASLLSLSAIDTLRKELLPLTTIVTPNIPEAEVLANMKIHTFEDRIQAAARIHANGVPYVFIKGGHDNTWSTCDDLLYDGSATWWFSSERRITPHTHGTGCTISAAMTAFLAGGASVAQAVLLAKQFVYAAIREPLNIGHGHGPVNHWAHRQRNAKGRDYDKSN